VRILLLTQVVPFPPDAGPKIKTYNVLRYLAQRHEVHLASFVRSAKEEEAAQSLASYCASVTTVPLRRSRGRDVVALGRSLATGRSFLVERDDSRAMRVAIADLLERHQFDAVHADQLTMGQFAVGLPVSLHVLDEHNAVWTIVRRAAAQEHWGPKRLLAELEWRKLRGYEGDLCRRFDDVTVVSEQDAADLAGATGAALHAEVIPIAVDTDELPFVARGPAARHVVSVATMFYPPNIEGIHWFATEVFPSIRRAVPGTEFRVVGARPPAHIQQLSGPESGIVVTGYVQDLDPILDESAVLVVPLHSGSGMRVKIVEAFSRGIPIVSTTVGVEGIDARAGEHLLVADDPRDFAAAVSRLLQDPIEAARLARAGRELVESRYDWRTALVGLDRIYSADLAGAQPGGAVLHGDDRRPLRATRP
jgi:sugar transferase (PEP-CTERM/EpsH1 system associated)